MQILTTAVFDGCAGLNAVAMLGEYLLNNLTVRPTHVVFVAIWPSLYTLYQIFLLYPLENGHWAYPFMNTNTVSPVHPFHKIPFHKLPRFAFVFNQVPPEN